MRQDEKRQSQRYNVSIAPLDCKRSDHRPCDEDMDVTITNLSTSGIGVSVNKRLSEGDKVALRIIMPDDGIPMYVVGLVSWIKKDKKDSSYIAGMHLVEINDVDRKRLAHYICSQFIIVPE